MKVRKLVTFSLTVVMAAFFMACEKQSADEAIEAFEKNIRELNKLRSMPSLVACANSILISVRAEYLPVKGLQQLIKTKA